VEVRKMPFGYGPWWALSAEERRRFWRYAWRCWRFPWLPRGWWAIPYFSEYQGLTKEEEIELLKEEAKAIEEEQKALKQELEEIRKRIEELKKKK